MRVHLDLEPRPNAMVGHPKMVLQCLKWHKMFCDVNSMILSNVNTELCSLFHFHMVCSIMMGIS